jgi:hypothetical protein
MRIEEIKWNFQYNNKNFENTLRDMNIHGDFLFKQNENCLRMDQIGERYFLPLLIYGMQKIKSPEEAKKDLEKKDYIKGEGFDIPYSNGDAYWYFSPVFSILDNSNKFEIKGSYESDLSIRIDKEFKTFRNMKEEIILPYLQLSKAIDKLIIASQSYFFRTNHEDLSKIIDYYVSGEFERYHQHILSQIH